MTLGELTAKLGGELEGDGKVRIRGVGTLETVRQDEVSFLANARYEKHMEKTDAAAVIVARDYSGPVRPGTALIRCQDAYFAFRETMVLFHGFRSPHFEGIDERANIDPSAKIADGVRVAAFATVAGGCEIGEGTVIYPGVYLGEQSRIGRECILYPNVTLYDGTILGDRVIIHAGSSIGHDGFGYATHKHADGVVRHEKIPQAGWVEIGDDVEIGACCTIDRATMGATIVGPGTKFSNLVAIGHGTQMGKHCLMVAQSGISGSVKVGNYCTFAGQCGVVGHISIGDGVRVGAKAGVTNDIEPGLEVLGSPAVPRTEAKRAIISLNQLPQLRDAMRRLTSEVQSLRRKLGLSTGDEGGEKPSAAKDDD
ncbi:MAG: UDP-3-O-(3-hydroxymyristoyl)glucosamine N-acyltransferase [Planctomycetota bacterium]|jgi:UDP-3-O-[3-hydroxymyristoyl] glucosamine N-acyltransferase